MTLDVAGRAIIITGACGGIGSACVRLLAARGARLTMVDRHLERLIDLERSVGEGEMQSLRLDVTSESDMAHMAEAAVARFGGIDALVSAAGILRTNGQPRPVSDTSFEEWRTVIDVNLTGTFLSNRAVLPAMLRRGTGDIVNISSTSGRRGRPLDAAYCASKFGVVGFSESLAEEVGRLGIRVQTLLPDAVDTPLWEQSGSASLKPRAMLSADRVAEFVLYLLTLSRDAFLLNPLLYPLPLRVRRPASAAASTAKGGAAIEARSPAESDG
jgi:NAD(P)-dependent dehydrogenase (short-subunit alcohol dehydrogenase family)